MKKLILLLFFIPVVHAIGIGVVPGEIDSDNNSSFRILNPNEESILFRLNIQGIDCYPTNGSIGPRNSSRINCAKTHSPEPSIIVESYLMMNINKYGIIPAVAIKIKHNNTGSEPIIKEREINPETPGENTNTPDDSTPSSEPAFFDNIQILAIIVLTIIVIGLLIKNVKPDDASLQ